LLNSTAIKKAPAQQELFMFTAAFPLSESNRRRTF